MAPFTATRPGQQFARPLPHLALALWLLVLTLQTAHAGAWPREKGTGFVSVASRVAASEWVGPYNIYTTTYLEYGLGRRLTAGFDVGHGISGTSKAVFFLRKSLPEMGNGHVFAAELGLGVIADEPVIRPGLSYGKGLQLPGGPSGWISVESTAEIRLDTGETDFKADFTVGLNHGDRFKTILQLQTGLQHGDPSFLRAAPSFAIKMGKSSHLELGLTAGLIGDQTLGLKLGFWRGF